MLETDCKRLDAEKTKVYEELMATERKKRAPMEMTVHPVTMEGKIDGHALEIRGMVPRGGIRCMMNPSGPCMWCTRMLELGSTELMISRGVRCQWAGYGRRGHICSFPAVLKAFIESEEFTQRMRSNRVGYRRAKKPQGARGQAVNADEAD